MSLLRAEIFMRKVLFVDDMPDVLEAVRKTLTPMTKEWEMAFVTSGKAALDWLRQNSYDVIVSDMVMPGMDGIQLLSEVRMHYPHMVRIGFSGTRAAISAPARPRSRTSPSPSRSMSRRSRPPSSEPVPCGNYSGASLSGSWSPASSTCRVFRPSIVT